MEDRVIEGEAEFDVDYIMFDRLKYIKGDYFPFPAAELSPDYFENINSAHLLGKYNDYCDF